MIMIHVDMIQLILTDISKLPKIIRSSEILYFFYLIVIKKKIIIVAEIHRMIDDVIEIKVEVEVVIVKVVVEVENEIEVVVEVVIVHGAIVGIVGIVDVKRKENVNVEHILKMKIPSKALKGSILCLIGIL